MIGALIRYVLRTTWLAVAIASFPDAGHAAGRSAELLVRFKPTVSTHAAEQRHAARRARVARRFHVVPNLELVAVPDDVSLADALAAYRRDPAVAYAEPNGVVRTALVPDDPMFGDLWNMAQIDAPAAWSFTTGDPGVVVAVPDSGIEYTHPDLAANMFRNEPDCDSNGIDDDGNGYADDCFGIDVVNGDSDPMDDNHHGTVVAGVIGAVGNNGVGVVGLNWGVQLLACKMIGANGVGTIGDAIACLDYVAAMKARGVNVVGVNASWAADVSSEALLDAIEALTDADVLVVAAAGNGSTDLASCPVYPAAYYTPGLLSVAMTEQFDALSEFSSFGPGTVHLAAPGGYTTSFGGILSTTLNGGYERTQGTSLAAPHVTGAAALLKAQDPSRDWKSIKNLLLASGESRPTLAATTISGRRLDARGALGCTSAELVAGLHPGGDHHVASEGVPFTAALSAIHVRCGEPGGDLGVVRQPGNETIPLRDDGTGSDRVAGDGIYTSDWTASLHQTSTLTYPDGDVETVHVWPVLSNMLPSPPPNVNESFGRALATAGPYLFVGAPGDAKSGTAFCHFGAVHVYDADTRALLRTIVSPVQDTSTGPDIIAAQLGAALAADGGRLLVGAPYSGHACLQCQEGQLLLFDPGTGDFLRAFESHDNTLLNVGTSVALVGNTAVAGSPRQAGGAGAAVVFDVTSGALLATLVPTSSLDARFGRAVAATPTRIAVASAGAVYVFDGDRASPTFAQLLFTHDAQTYGGDFGSVMTFVGDALVVGAPSYWNPVRRANGAVFVFDGPTLVRTWFNPLSVDDDPSFVSAFGASLAPAGNAVVIGAPEAGGDRRGLAYVYSLDATTPAGIVRAIAPLHGSAFGSAVGALGDQFFVAAPGAFEGAGFGAVFAFGPTLGFPPEPEFAFFAVKSFTLRDDNAPPIDAARRGVRLKAVTRAYPPANRIVPPLPGSEGDPTLHGAVLTVHNAAGLTLDAATVSLPATDPVTGDGWVRLRTGGYTYKSKSLTGPIARVIVKADRLTVRGGKASWSYTLDEAAQGAVAVRLQLGTAPTWCAVIPASAPQHDVVDQFVGLRDAPVPTVCPPLP